MLGLSVKSFTKIEEFSTKSTPETLPNLCTAARKWIATIFFKLAINVVYQASCFAGLRNGVKIALYKDLPEVCLCFEYLLYDGPTVMEFE